MKSVGLRELRQNASEIIRDAEAGVETTVTVSGRPVAKVVPIGNRMFRTWDEVKHIWDTPTDPNFLRDIRAFGDDVLEDPWERHAHRS